MCFNVVWFLLAQNYALQSMIAGVQQLKKEDYEKFQKFMRVKSSPDPDSSLNPNQSYLGKNCIPTLFDLKLIDLEMIKGATGARHEVTHLL
jgi:hypothetical protein